MSGRVAWAAAVLLCAACTAPRARSQEGARGPEHARVAAANPEEGEEQSPLAPGARNAPHGHAGENLEPEKTDEAVRRYLDAYGYEREDFEPVPDRWRVGLPRWDRLGRSLDGWAGTDQPYMIGEPWNPYRQNVLKGDYPILGNHTFLVLTAISDTVLEARDVPTFTAISTAEPFTADFFGEGRQDFVTTNLVLSAEVLIGNAAFKPPEWVFRATTVFNLNYLEVDENNVVNIDVREGTTRTDEHVGLQELFVEKHLVDLSPNYDFLSITIGIQQFVSDFRGFVFFDNNLGFRATFNLDNNRTQVNAAVFWQLEKDTNSELNALETRDQLVVIVNAFRQDFIWFGYTISGSIHYNHDDDSVHFDENQFPVRPPVLGDATPHRLDIVYLGVAGDGHIGRLNITHEYFLALGRDTNNPLAGRRTDVVAHMFFVELSIDYDWLRPRVSFLWASGDDDPQDDTAKGFDSILDNPNFAGGLNSFWIRQQIRLLGVGLVHRLSAFPSLRSSKVEGQANFVNPGLFFFNVGLDAEVTAELRASLNASYLRFQETGSLEPFVNQNDIDAEIGTEVTLSAIYRPWLTNNIQLAGGLSVFFPGKGFGQLFEERDTLFSAFLQFTFIY